MAVRLDCFISWSWFDDEGKGGGNGYMSGVMLTSSKGFVDVRGWRMCLDSNEGVFVSQMEGDEYT